MSVFKRVVCFVIYSLSSLVNAQTCQNTIVPTTPTQAFTLHSNGTATHHKTGLLWQRCLQGQSFDGSACHGTPSTYTWGAALQAAQSANQAQQLSYSDWRLPNKNELASIVERACYNPAINLTVFLNASSSVVWSSSPGASYSNYAWYVNFNHGYVINGGKNDNFQVRLVRGGQ